MVSTFALTWSPASLYYVATPPDPDDDHAWRRAALAATVRRAFVPEGSA